MVKLLVVALGGSIGAVLRYLLSGWVHRRYEGEFPGGTLLVNVLGCLVIGGLMAAVEDRGALSPNWRLFLSMGLIGSLTTFSTFGHETVELLGDDEVALALGNVAANVVLGVLAVLLGRAIVRGLWG